MKLKNRILEVLDTFGMSGTKAAQAMKISYAAFRKKKSDKTNGDCFNEQNYRNLISYIKEKAEELVD
ncbi:hypothetical protein Q361_11736 [Flavobacterium croceum DSM 17960]|uniref:Uncharacterized protein n=1 Tax=Flavobacterium croceum DSM 17960 TaxID=1121886 RepID=A0A2S4N5B0_9FLAO|nr:hypothetical protein [Flavobacterium croceum]POS00932.1 hypothetical protein Q361_11736 [Flavobacterium croceum DSM 17960]